MLAQVSMGALHWSFIVSCALTNAILVKVWVCGDYVGGLLCVLTWVFHAEVWMTEASRAYMFTV